jgi:hypothetical protein
MQRIVTALEDPRLDQEGRYRVIAWAWARFGGFE